MKYIITGYKGFVGSSLYKLFPESFVFEKDDIYDEKMVEECDGIFHIGGCADLREPDINSMFFYNVDRSTELFRLAKSFNKRVVFTSSSAIYGNDGAPTNSYSCSKYCTELNGAEMLQNNFIALRLFNVYGSGEEHKGLMSSIPYHIYKAKKFGIFPATVYNSGYIPGMSAPWGPRSPRRDFIYIDDVINALISAMNNNISGTYDVGTCKATPYEDICRIMGTEYYFTSIKDKPDGYQNYTRANEKNLLPDWELEFDIKSGLKKYKSYLENKEKADDDISKGFHLGED